MRIVTWQRVIHSSLGLIGGGINLRHDNMASRIAIGIIVVCRHSFMAFIQYQSWRALNARRDSRAADTSRVSRDARHRLIIIYHI